MLKRESAWLAGIDTSARPSLEGDRTAAVVVVGGGVAGMTTALLLQEDGFDVALLEAERIGHGTTGNSTGKVSSLHGLLYHTSSSSATGRNLPPSMAMPTNRRSTSSKRWLRRWRRSAISLACPPTSTRHRLT